MDRFTCRMAFLAAMAPGILLTGCGGSSGSSDSSLQYVGNTAAAVITPANASNRVATLLEAGDLTDTFPTALLTGAPVVMNGVRSLHQAKAVVNESEPCFPSGRIDITGNLDERTGTGSLTLSFLACLDGDSLIDGTADWVITAADIGDGFWMPTDSIFTLHKMTFVDPGTDLVLDGSLREQLSITGETTMTLNFVSQDRLTSRMMKTENLQLITRFGDTYFLSERVSGRIYDSIDGYLDLTTPQELRFSNGDSRYPASGQFLVTGAGGAQMRLIALSEEMAELALNLDGDSAFEVVGELPWEVIDGAGDDPADSDGDGIADSWEAQYGLSSSTFADASLDGDGDSLSSYREFQLQSDPTSDDSDDDGMGDGWEVANGFNLISNSDATLDADGDQATNLQEHDYGTDPWDVASAPADMALSLRASSPIVSRQSLFEYQLEAVNQGPGVAREPLLKLTLPAGVVIDTAVPGILPSPWDCAVGAGTLSCESPLGMMDPGAMVTIAVPVVAPNELGLATGNATVDTATLDYAGGNDTVSVDVDVAPPVLRQIALAVNGIDGIEGLERPFRSAISPDGKHLYVPGIVDDAVAVFEREPATGLLTFIEAQREGIDTPVGEDQIPKPDFPKAVVVSPDGKHVYVATEWSQGEWIGSVIAFSRNADTGQLTHLATYRDGEAGIDGIAQAIALTLSNGGDQLYVAGPNDNAVAVFQRDPATGLLTFSEAMFNGADGVSGLAGPFDLMLSPDNQYLYVAGSLDNAVVIFRRDSGGLLSYVGQVGVAGFPQSLAISPDGEHLYCLADGVYAFSRDAVSGELQALATYRNGEQPIVGLEGFYALDLSPDGTWIVVAAQHHGAIGLFARDPDSGELRFIETHKDGVGLDEGLGGAWELTFSPDGNHLYVSSGSDNAVSSFVVEHDNAR